MRGLIFFVALILTACAKKTQPKLFLVDPFLGDKSRYQTTSKGAIISSQGDASSKAGQLMFQKGGTIVDAAIAVSFAISVERPQSTGIGGGGFLIFYEKKTSKFHVFDFREQAPLKSSSNMFLEKDGSPNPLRSIYGALSVGTPGLVKGLWEIHQKFGKLQWHQLLEPAIELAERGFPVYKHLEEAIAEESPELRKDAEALKIFFHANGQPLKSGDTLKQSDLARSLRLIAKDGVDAFYKGSIAQSIVDTVSDRGGILNLTDLANYQVKTREPVRVKFRDFEIVSMPPPSSGGTHIIQILNMLELQNISQWGPQHPEAIHRTATAMQIAFADRAKYMGDPDFSAVPVSELTSKSYAQHLQRYFSSSALSSSLFPLKKIPDGPTETTHFTLADKDENVIVSTQTINGWFGSTVIARGTGIVLNNEMDDFAQSIGASNLFGAIGGENNLVAPEKRPLSSMSPTIVLKDNRPFLALGTPSGTRILTCVTQVILNVIEYKLPLYEAVAATRIHHQWQPEELAIEEPFFPGQTIDKLRLKGHKVVSFPIGCEIQAVQRTGDQWLGVSDPRGVGLAVPIDY